MELAAFRITRGSLQLSTEMRDLQKLLEYRAESLGASIEPPWISFSLPIKWKWQ